MPVLVKFLIRHAAFGFLLAILAVTAMMITDFAGLGTLIANSDVGILALFLLTFFLGLTLSSVQMGAAIILLNDRSSGGGRRGPDWRRWLAEAPSRVPALATRAPRPTSRS